MSPLSAVAFLLPPAAIVLAWLCVLLRVLP